MSRWVLSAMLGTVVDGSVATHTYSFRCVEQNAHFFTDHALSAWTRRMVQVLATRSGAAEGEMPTRPTAASIEAVRRWPRIDGMVDAVARAADARLVTAGAAEVRRALLLSEIIIHHFAEESGKPWTQLDSVPYAVPVAALLARCSESATGERLKAAHPATDLDMQAEIPASVLVPLARCTGLGESALVRRVEVDLGARPAAAPSR